MPPSDKPGQLLECKGVDGIPKVPTNSINQGPKPVPGWVLGLCSLVLSQPAFRPIIQPGLKSEIPSGYRRAPEPIQATRCPADRTCARRLPRSSRSHHPTRAPGPGPAPRGLSSRNPAHTRACACSVGLPGLSGRA